LIEKYNVKGFYTAPTAVRFLRKEDPNGDFIKKYNISSLKCISLAGERYFIIPYICIDVIFQLFNGFKNFSLIL
jgi:propionyl-CoA synthetase